MSFWKVHILHHAAEAPIHGHWIVGELRRHGYEISPGTLYPLLNRMERLGWLKSRQGRGARARRDYRLTLAGKKLLGFLREQVAELHHEVVNEERERRRRS